MIRLGPAVGGLILGLVIGAVGCWWVAARGPQAVPGGAAPALVGKVPVPQVRTVYVYKDAKLPKGVTKGEQVVAGGVFRQGGVVTSLIDQTGHIRQVQEPLSAPWFARAKGWSGSLYAGMQGGSIVYRGTATRDVAQIKDAYISFTVSADKYPDETRIFTGVGVRF